MRTLTIVICVLFLCVYSSDAQERQPYWNHNTQLLPWRINMAAQMENIEYIDLDRDGDPDVLKNIINDSIPVLWIDDDDDMKSTDIEGDTDSDCLLVDRNCDGIFAGPFDLSIDWNDENADGICDIQLVAQNGGLDRRNDFDWSADFMYIIDLEEDGIQHYVNWNKLKLEAWEHNGHSNFFEDYHGNTLFLKMHASSFRINDTRYSWENPFIFYDHDEDGLTEMAIRFMEEPHFRPKTGTNEIFSAVDEEIDIVYSKVINWVSMAFDLDNDNGQGNEFDYDMSLRFTGEGFDYSDQVHTFHSLRGLPEANTYFYDSRWRENDELIYADHNSAWDLTFNRGKWNQCWLTFDEDDDCNRWERIELYQNKDAFAYGDRNGGLDHNGQADGLGDRGEWDEDFSGEGKLYIAAFDGRMHLYGAEKGHWRVDQTAYSFQGFGGLYDRWKEDGRLQKEQDKFATLSYFDTNDNGFFDVIKFDLDGDAEYEEEISLADLNINDEAAVIDTRKLSYQDLQDLFKEQTLSMWENAAKAVELSNRLGLNTDWYAFWKNPRTLHEKYEYAFWLNFYLYKDLCEFAGLQKDQKLLNSLHKAYFSGDWSIVETNDDSLKAGR